ncbi:MAG: hypothetical protein Q9218_008233 [Villophora microphyllina]
MLRGASVEIDKRFADIHNERQATDAVHVVRRLAQVESDLIIEVSRSQAVDEWKATYIKNHVNDMMAQLRPMIAPGLSPYQLGNTFASILGDAWRIGMKILMTTAVLHFDFPVIGNDFEKRYMINRDPYTTGTPRQLEDSRARVTLGITPRVTMDNIMSDAPARQSVKIVHMGNVLLRVPA